jgi:hypothetical protein
MYCLNLLTCTTHSVLSVLSPGSLTLVGILSDTHKMDKHENVPGVRVRVAYLHTRLMPTRLQVSVDLGLASPLLMFSAWIRCRERRKLRCFVKLSDSAAFGFTSNRKSENRLRGVRRKHTAVSLLRYSPAAVNHCQRSRVKACGSCVGVLRGFLTIEVTQVRSNSPVQQQLRPDRPDHWASGCPRLSPS